MTTPTLTEEIAQRFARIALGHVRREYPNKPDHTLAGPQDAQTPRQLHPVFYGSYDWHSCVHSYWMLARLLRRHPTMEAAADIVALFDAQLVPEKVAVECAYLAQPTARGFKRPYGWGWLLKLASELKGLDDGRWGQAIAPLAEAFAQRFRDFLPIATLSGAGRHAFQHGFRPADGCRLCRCDRGWRLPDPAARDGPALVWRRRGLPGLGRTER